MEEGFILLSRNFTHTMAAPHVSGVIALMKAIYPQLTPQEFNLALFNGDLTDDLGARGRDDDFGWGLINAAKAVRTAAQLASGQSSDPGPILSASTAVVDFGAFQQELALNLRNIGTGSLMITQISSTEPWLEVQPPATADGLGNYTLRVDRTGLADGAYEAPLLWLSDGWATVVHESWRAPLYWEEKDGAWLAMSLQGLRPIDPAAPVTHVSYYEAEAYARVLVGGDEGRAGRGHRARSRLERLGIESHGFRRQQAEGRERRESAADIRTTERGP